MNPSGDGLDLNELLQTFQAEWLFELGNQIVGLELVRNDDQSILVGVLIFSVEYDVRVLVVANQKRARVDCQQI